ncbi:MAG: MerR family transcriptional regulator [Pseudomonadota bacterium]
MKKPISEKMFYKIGEVAEMTGLEPYVLRYWEGEFGLKLTKSKNHQRLYQRKDIDQIVRIRILLYEEKFTIAGAKKKLRGKRPEKVEGQQQLTLALPNRGLESKVLKETLRKVRSELESMVEILSTPSSGHA